MVGKSEFVCPLLTAFTARSCVVRCTFAFHHVAGWPSRETCSSVLARIPAAWISWKTKRMSFEEESYHVIVVGLLRDSSQTKSGRWNPSTSSSQRSATLLMTSHSPVSSADVPPAASRSHKHDSNNPCCTSAPSWSKQALERHVTCTRFKKH